MMRSPIGSEVTVAAIGALATVFAAVIPNWGSIFLGHKYVRESYVGYTPTGDFDKELRVFYELSGFRETFKTEMQSVLGTMREQYEQLLPAQTEAIDFVLDSVAKAGSYDLLYDQVIDSTIPVAREYFTTAQLQELNKLYSTQIMQAMVKAQPHYIKDVYAVAKDVGEAWGKEVGQRLAERLAD
jgi:hypothetical protein